ncbi:hypothetical protein HMI56_003656 [Coelomomyces lativittatus]|nr:hypothetical protein HMI56_003656 [Coelomomyces lativittatus]
MVSTNVDRFHEHNKFTHSYAWKRFSLDLELNFLLFKKFMDFHFTTFQWKFFLSPCLGLGSFFFFLVGFVGFVGFLGYPTFVHSITLNNNDHPNVFLFNGLIKPSLALHSILEVNGKLMAFGDVNGDQG